MTTMTYFTNGKFGTGPAPENFGNGQGSPERAGYTLTDALGVGSSPVVVLYSRQDPEATGPGWLIAVSDSSVTEYIGANSLRDVMDLQARWAPVAVASIASYLFEILAGPDESTGSSGVIPWLIGRIRADEREGLIDQAESEILAARQDRRREWMASQATPAAPGAEVSDQQPGVTGAASSPS